MTEPTPVPQTKPVPSRIENQYRDSIERQSRIDRAWASPAVAAIRELIRADGNVDWPEFVSHCGGILKVAAMVDGNGKPDTDRLIPLVDELFSKYAVTEYAGGLTMTRKPKNRPYLASGAPRRAPGPAFPGAEDRGPADLSEAPHIKTTSSR